MYEVKLKTQNEQKSKNSHYWKRCLCAKDLNSTSQTSGHPSRAIRGLKLVRCTARDYLFCLRSPLHSIHIKNHTKINGLHLHYYHPSVTRLKCLELQTVHSLSHTDTREIPRAKERQTDKAKVRDERSHVPGPSSRIFICCYP